MIINRDYRSPNFNERPDGRVPDMVILHYTGMKTGHAALKRLCEPEAQVSAHYMIEEDGRVFELVSPGKRAWHAGVSHWQGRDNLNHYTIGIEIVNPGHEFGYRAFPDVQIAALLDLLHLLSRQFFIPSANYVGHSDIAPMRKMDPGEKFPWSRLAGAGFGIWPDQDGADTTPILGRSDLGADADAIRDLQSHLETVGYGLEITGDFCDLTQACVTAFQRHWRPAYVNGFYDVGTKSILCDIVDKIKET